MAQVYPKGIPALPHEDYIITFKSNPRWFKHHGKIACHVDALVSKVGYPPSTRRYRTRDQNLVNQIKELCSKAGNLSNVRVYFDGLLSKPEILENPNIPLPEYTEFDPRRYVDSTLLRGKDLPTSIRIVKIDKNKGPTSFGRFGISDTQYQNASKVGDQFYVIFDHKNSDLYGIWHSDIHHRTVHTIVSYSRQYWLIEVGNHHKISTSHWAVKNLEKEEN